MLPTTRPSARRGNRDDSVLCVYVPMAYWSASQLSVLLDERRTPEKVRAQMGGEVMDERLSSVIVDGQPPSMIARAALAAAKEETK